MGELQLIIQPDPEETAAAEVFVDGQVAGRPYRFLLDTGAARTALLYDDYTATFSSHETSQSSGVFSEIHDDVITVPSLKAGSIVRRNATVVRSTGAQGHRTSLIGMDILKDFRCHFLFDKARVALDEAAVVELQYPLQTLVFDQKFHPYVAVHLGDQTGQAVWDTGASITIVDRSFIQRHPAYFQAVGESEGTDAAGTTVQTPMFRMAAVVIGGCAFQPHPVAGVDLSRVNATLERPMDLILGYSTLSQANWLFDFPGKQWAVSKRLS